VCGLPLAWPVSHSCPSLFRVLLVVLWDVCLGVTPAHALCLGHCHPSTALPRLFPDLCRSQFSASFPVSCSTAMGWLHRCLLLSSSSSPMLARALRFPVSIEHCLRLGWACVTGAAFRSPTLKTPGCPFSHLLANSCCCLLFTSSLSSWGWSVRYGFGLHFCNG
jgi:hypothetical protein